MALEFHTHTRRPHVSRLEDCPDDECLVFCPFHGAMHCSSVISQKEVAQSEMVMVYLPNSTGVDRLGIASPMAPTRKTTLGRLSQYHPSRTPWYIASRCVFDLA